MYRIGFDVGGTFTDFTLHDTGTGALHHFKLPTTPADPSRAIADGVAALMATHKIAPDQISFVGHGTTIATNMVIERRGVPTGLITTKGFRDVLEIGRQVRPHLYDYTVRTSPPLVPRERRIEVPERLDADGAVLLPLDDAAVLAAARTLGEQGVQAIAICFLHAYLNDTHERRTADLVRSVLPDVFLSTSSGVLPEFREFERFSTTAINATIGPRVERYLQRLLHRLSELGITAPPHTIHSNGGLMSVETVRAFPVRICLSGPAAVVVGAAEIAGLAGLRNVITFDAGGTSTDVSLIADGRPAFATARQVAQYPVRTPMVDVQVIGAGGGSIAWLDDAGGLKVGPHSAGADPGPVAYGKGGSEPTLTDANIVLHRLDPVALLGGRMPVNEAAANAAIRDRIAAPLGLTVEQAALGIIRIAVSNMSRAIRSVSTEKGHDVGDFALFPYGGAGPLHVAAVAAESGISRVLVPVEPGTLCARGILLSDLSQDQVRSAIIPVDDTNWPRIVEAFAAMIETGRAWLEREAVPTDHRRFDRVIDARYKGQNHEVQVNGEFSDRVTFLHHFATAHQREYGYTADRGVEIVNCRLKAVGLIDRPAASFTGGSGPPTAKATRRVHFDDTWHDTPIFDRATLAVGASLPGPAVIDEMSATTLVPPGWNLHVDPAGNLILETL